MAAEHGPQIFIIDNPGPNDVCPSGRLIDNCPAVLSESATHQVDVMLNNVKISPGSDYEEGVTTGWITGTTPNIGCTACGFLVNMQERYTQTLPSFRVTQRLAFRDPQTPVAELGDSVRLADLRTGNSAAIMRE